MQICKYVKRKIKIFCSPVFTTCELWFSRMALSEIAISPFFPHCVLCASVGKEEEGKSKSLKGNGGLPPFSPRKKKKNGWKVSDGRTGREDGKKRSPVPTTIFPHSMEEGRKFYIHLCPVCFSARENSLSDVLPPFPRFSNFVSQPPPPTDYETNVKGKEGFEVCFKKIASLEKK